MVEGGPLKLPVIPPEGSAFALAQRNLDPIPERARERWAGAILDWRRPSDVPLPERLILELVNSCNLDCPMCRVGEYGVDLRRRMPFELFTIIASQLFPRVREVRLNGLGETTLLPDLDRYLDVLDRHGARIELITNGTGSVAIYRRLLAGGATVLISWDAARPEVFERVRRPARWAPLASTVEETARFAIELGRRDSLHLLYTLQPGTERELPGIVELAARWGIGSVVTNVAKLPARDWIERIEAAALVAFAEADRAATQLGVRLSLPDHLGARRIDLPAAMPSAASACDRPFKEAVIRWNGDVQVCNMFNPYAYGNLELGPFEQWWNGAFASAFRSQFRAEPGHPYCTGCYYLAGVYEKARG
jgi:radical SAM protein with 4Fe4S-binding SPASM domain